MNEHIIQQLYSRTLLPAREAFDGETATLIRAYRAGLWSFVTYSAYDVSETVIYESRSATPDKAIEVAVRITKEAARHIAIKSQQIFCDLDELGEHT